jgi:hypothetical protein
MVFWYYQTYQTCKVIRMKLVYISWYWLPNQMVEAKILWINIVMVMAKFFY